MLSKVKDQLGIEREKPVVVIGAGIATEENLDKIKGQGYDYVCVSRIHPKGFDMLSEKATLLQHNRGNQTEVQKVAVEEKDDTFMHIKSEQKGKKEKSMNQKIAQRFEERSDHLKEGLGIPVRVKKTARVHEMVGQIKDQFSKVVKIYKIAYEENAADGVVTDIKWERQTEKERPMGGVFPALLQEKPYRRGRDMGSVQPSPGGGIKF